MRLTPAILVAVTLLVATGGKAASAQDIAPPAHFSVSSGLFQFKLSGNGLAPMVATRAAFPVASVLLFEAGLLAARPGQQFGETTTFLVPEAQVQLALPFTSVLPYMGLGLGAAVDLRSGSAGGVKGDMTISGSLGIKTWLRDRLGAQLEFRGRGVGVDFEGTSSEYTLGLLWRR